MTKWLYPRVRNHNKGRVGLMRRHGLIGNVTARAERSDIRERLTKWDENANEHLAPSFKKMVLTRAEVAKLRGFENYLDFKSQFKMMDGKAAMAFLEGLRKAIAPQIESYMEDLLEMKMKDMDSSFSMAGLRHDIWKGRYTIQDFQEFDPSRKLHWGEVSYYPQTQKEKHLWDGKLEKIHEYFPLDSTVRGLLDLFGHLFGLRFSEVSDQQQYNTIISAYLSSGQCSAPLIDREKLPALHVQDTSRSAAGEAHLGILVLDLIERPGKAHTPNCGWFSAFSTSDPKNGEKDPNKVPGYSISAGFSKATSKLPTMLSHGELKSLAHELGHAIHDFVRGTISGVPWDAIEIPSTLCEHWVGDPRILQKLSSHYTYLNPAYLGAWRSSNPGKDRPPIEAPLDTLDAVAFKRRPANRIREYQQDLWMSKFDLMVHSYSEKDLEKADLAKDCQDILREWTGISSAGDSKHHNNSYLNWTALNTYQTSYYCYLLSEVYSIDIFEKYFAKDPLNRKQGIRFRRMFLEHRDRFSSIAERDSYKSDPIKRLRLFLSLRMQGGSENVMDALEKFMGRKLSNKAFIKSLNAPAKKQKSFWTRLKVNMGFGW
ncbi:zincin [Acephala macrosclerotiorum]|nr:zincin [Acephala macrosclerotiorum]